MKLRQPASRAAEIAELRDRLRVERSCKIADEERELIEAAHTRKLSISRSLNGVSSCASCAVGDPSPYSGGACCSGITARIFDDTELSTLAHAGTHVSDLRPPPRSDAHVGCAFRGDRGCSLETEHRPARCVHYVCDTLKRELFDRGQLDAAEAALAELRTIMERLAVLRAQRADADVLAPLVAALEDAARR